MKLDILKTAKKFWECHNTTILSAIACGGVILTAYFASKESLVANKKLASAQEEKDLAYASKYSSIDISKATLTRFEKLKVAVPCYIKTSICAIATIGCIWGSHYISANTIASLTSSYAILKSQFNDYRTETNNIFGDAADDTVRESVVKKKLDNSFPVADGRRIIFVEPVFKTEFVSTYDRVKIAEGELNRLLICNGQCSIRDFYELLGVEPPENSEDYGWSTWSDAGFDPFNGYIWIDFEHYSKNTPEGEKCYIGYFTGPFDTYLEDD